MDHNQQNHIIYFASDFHLGVPSFKESIKREKKLVNWLSMAAKDATEIFLVGDLFDFWFEYKYTIPKGYTRFLGKVADIVDSGIPVYVFTGNHDMWMFDYLEKEIGITIIRKPKNFTFNSKTSFLSSSLKSAASFLPSIKIINFFKISLVRCRASYTFL